MTLHRVEACVNRSQRGFSEGKFTPRIGDVPPRLRAPGALSPRGIGLILLRMENISTRTKPVLPWITNVLTVAVVLTAAYWSNAQRPDAPAQQAAATAPAVTQVKQAPSVAPAQGATQAVWTAPTTSLQRDSVQTVGFATIARR